MLTWRFVAGIFFTNVLLVATDMVSGQNYPSKPIRILTNDAGGASDFAARIISKGISVPLGQPVIVDNRIGPTEIAVRAPPDGHTLHLAASAMWILPYLRNNVPWDPLRDFSPITMLTRIPNVLVVHPALPARSVKELIALAKARPGELNYAAGARGGQVHLASELFMSMAGINIVSVPYKSSPASTNALLAGEVQVMFPSTFSVVPHIKSGRLRGLAVTSAQPFALVPDLPTVSASGLPGYEYGGMTGMFAPAKTPRTYINRLNLEILRVIDSPDVKEQFLSTGVTAVGSSPEEFAATIKSDMTKMSKLIKNAGIKAD